MKIGIITGDMNQVRAGIDNYIYQLIIHLKSRYEIILIRHESGMDIPGCESIIIKNYLKKKYNSLIWSQSLIFHKNELKGLDLIHNPGQFLIPPLKGIKIVTTIHDLTPVLFPQYHFPFRTWSNKIFLPLIIRKTSAIIVDSVNTKRDIFQFYNISEEKITVINCAADSCFSKKSVEEVLEWKKKRGYNDPYILFVGTIEPRKNIHTLLDAFSIIGDRYNNLQLILAGSPGWKSDPIYAEIKYNRFKDRIKLLNYVPYEELPLLYNGAIAFIFPSWYEGFGFPPLEAMQCGTPVVSSKSSSLPEIIGEGGIMINPHNISEFSDAICKIIDDDSFRNEQIKYGLSRAKKFSWQETAAKTAEVYERINEGVN